jgi:hypothetical protein
VHVFAASPPPRTPLGRRDPDQGPGSGCLSQARTCARARGEARRAPSPAKESRAGGTRLRWRPRQPSSRPQPPSRAPARCCAAPRRPDFPVAAGSRFAADQAAPEAPRTADRSTADRSAAEPPTHATYGTFEARAPLERRVLKTQSPSAQLFLDSTVGGQRGPATQRNCRDASGRPGWGSGRGSVHAAVRHRSWVCGTLPSVRANDVGVTPGQGGRHTGGCGKPSWPQRGPAHPRPSLTARRADVSIPPGMIRFPPSTFNTARREPRSRGIPARGECRAGEQANTLGAVGTGSTRSTLTTAKDAETARGRRLRPSAGPFVPQTLDQPLYAASHERQSCRAQTTQAATGIRNPCQRDSRRYRAGRGIRRAVVRVGGGGCAAAA